MPVEAGQVLVQVVDRVRWHDPLVRAKGGGCSRELRAFFLDLVPYHGGKATQLLHLQVGNPTRVLCWRRVCGKSVDPYQDARDSPSSCIRLALLSPVYIHHHQRVNHRAEGKYSQAPKQHHQADLGELCSSPEPGPASEHVQDMGGTTQSGCSMTAPPS